MDLLLTVTLIMVGLLLIWLIFCFIMMVKESKKIVIDEGMTGHVVCEKCNTAYDVTAAELMRGAVVKYKKVTKTEFDGAVRIKKPHYSYYAKRFTCPACGKMQFASVENLDELNTAATPLATKMLIKWSVIMAIGAAIIIIIFQIPLGIARKDKQRKIDEMKNQMYERLMDK